MRSTFERLRRGLGSRPRAEQPFAGGTHGASALHIAASASQPSKLLYARGFLLCKQDAPPVVRDWTVHRVGRWQLHLDPRVPIQHAAKGDRQAWLVGDAFDPSANVYQDMAAHLLGGDLLTTLDHAAGRFLLIVLQGERLEVYHDAMGSRSVFYGTDVVASHAGLVADVLGAGLREWIIPFITSKGWLNRDVKYLPGLDASFEGVAQLTPNTRLVLPQNKVERYWPRGPVRTTEREAAVDLLVEHVTGLRQYLESNGLRAIAGMSAGRDSRGVLAAIAGTRPRLFTFVRSKGGTSAESADSRAARTLAAACGLDLEIVKLAAPPPLDHAASDFAVAFRRNTGYVRGHNAGWVEHYANENDEDLLFIRGFGGEVMRGFYFDIPGISPAALAHTYDVNAGSCYSRDAFQRFIEVAQWRAKSLFDYALSDLLYWEHRMGTWGAVALSESDMAFRSAPGYNSRLLFSSFMGMAPDVRRKSGIFEEATGRLAPHLAVIPYES